VSYIIMHRIVDTNRDYSIMKYVHEVCIADDPSVDIKKGSLRRAFILSSKEGSQVAMLSCHSLRRCFEMYSYVFSFSFKCT
jgi:hypothetical protein